MACSIQHEAEAGREKARQGNRRPFPSPTCTVHPPAVFLPCFPSQAHLMKEQVIHSRRNVESQPRTRQFLGFLHRVLLWIRGPDETRLAGLKSKPHLVLTRLPAMACCCRPPIATEASWACIRGLAEIFYHLPLGAILPNHAGCQPWREYEAWRHGGTSHRLHGLSQQSGVMVNNRACLPRRLGPQHPGCRQFGARGSQGGGQGWGL